MGAGPFDTVVYIDAFNLYYGALRSTPYKWLDLESLCDRLLPQNKVVGIRYFTAIVAPRPNDPQAPQRQQIYLRALATLPRVSVHLGSFLQKTKHRPLVGGPGYAWVHDTEEKGSDVNLAAYLIHDGHRGRYATAAVISNDSDLKHPIELVRTDLGLRVGLLNPHAKSAFDLRGVADFYKQIRKGAIAASQFPPTLSDGQGSFTKPAPW